MNKFGDIFLLIGILALTIHFGSVDLEIIFSLLNPLDQKNIDILTLITLSIFVGVMSKSAQFGLHTWLPDAMEGERALLVSKINYHYLRKFTLINNFV